VCVYLCACACVRACIRMCERACVCMHVRVRVCTCVCMYVCIHRAEDQWSCHGSPRINENNEKAGRALRSTSNQSSEPCQGTASTAKARIDTDNTQTLNEQTGRLLRFTSNQSSDLCQVARYPQPRHMSPANQFFMNFLKIDNTLANTNRQYTNHSK